LRGSIVNLEAQKQLQEAQKAKSTQKETEYKKQIATKDDTI